MEIQFTADGSPTLYRADIDEHYHSVKGALAESRHVYIREGLAHRAALSPNRPLRVLEIGFGTGLNAALAAAWAAESGTDIYYTSLELYPVNPQTAARLDYGVPFLTEVNAAPWDAETRLHEQFTLHKRVADFLNCDLPRDIDVVFFDAFAPEKQPEMWSDEALARTVEAMAPGGVFVTYCAKGVIRRRLQALGLKPERLAGPPGGKREILRAVKEM